MSSPWTLVGNLVNLLDENNTVRVGPPVIGSSTPKLEVSGTLVATEAANVPLQDKGGNVFDVRAYGAAGDGVTDDLPMINTAIAALRDGGGGTLYFPPGVYKVTDEILLDGWIPGASKQVHFLVRGAGPGATTIKMANTATHGIRSVYGGALVAGRELFVEIRDLKLDASGPQTQTAGAAIRQECDPKFQNTFRVANCWFLNVYDGINTTASGSTIIKDCQFVDPRNAAILLEQRLPDNTDVGAVFISECLFFDKTQVQGGTSPYGLLATTGGPGVRLHHNAFVNFQHPVMFDHTLSPATIRTAIDIDDNIFDGISSGAKIHIKGHSELRSFHICNNQIHDGVNGILVEMTVSGPNLGVLWQGVIAGNIFKGLGPGAKGIVFNPTSPALCRDVLIASNHFYSMDVGIEMANDRCQFISIQANSFEEPGSNPPTYGVLTPIVNNGSSSRGAFFPDRIGVGRVNDVAVAVPKEIYAYSNQASRPRIYLQGAPGVSAPGIDFAFDNTNTRRAGLVATASGAAGVQLELFTKPDSATGITQRAVLDRDGNMIWTSPSYQEMVEVTGDPAAPAANKARLFVRDNGAGKTQLCVRFGSGAVQVLATQP